MKKIIITALLSTLVSSTSHAQEANKNTQQAKEEQKSTQTIADFKTEATSLRWNSINDGVMGGRSQGSSYITEASHLYFKGEISLKNNGGFSSIRTSGSKHDLSAFKGIQLRIKGDGRMYYLTTRTNGSRRIAYWSPIHTKKGEWVVVKVPFSTFYATSFGRKIPGMKLNTANISSIGFMLYDKKAGDFSLEVSEIKSYK